MKNKIILVLFLGVFTVFLINIVQNQQISGKETASFKTINPVKKNEGLDAQIEKGIEKETALKNDQVVSVFLEKLSNNDPTISILYGDNFNKNKSDKERKSHLKKIDKFISNGNKIIDCEIKSIKREKSIDTYVLQFTISDKNKKSQQKKLN